MEVCVLVELLIVVVAVVRFGDVFAVLDHLVAEVVVQLGVVTGGLHWSVIVFEARALRPALSGWGPSGAAGSAPVML